MFGFFAIDLLITRTGQIFFSQIHFFTHERIQLKSNLGCAKQLTASSRKFINSVFIVVVSSPRSFSFNNKSRHEPPLLLLEDMITDSLN